MNDTLLQQVKEHWRQLRGMSYDLLNELKEEDLHKKLPFPESQSIFYQFICMLGTTETFVDYIKEGKWGEWHCSLQPDAKDIPISQIKVSLERSDDVFPPSRR